MASTLSAEQLQNNNDAFVAKRDHGALPLPPAKKTLVLTCMDARIIVADAFGVQEGDVHVVRNAGGRAPEALRSIVISQQLLGTETIHVIQHTDCGMVTFQPEQAAAAAINGLGVDDSSPEAKRLKDLKWLQFPEVNQNVKDDVAYLRSENLVKSADVHGWVYDVDSGKLTKVA